MDISDPPQPLPAEYQPAVDALSKLGFSRLGETRVKITGVQTVKSRIFISADKLVFAELTEIKIQNWIFTTVYSDDAVLETGFPCGEKIETAFFRSHTITTDLEKAYRHQVQQLDSFGRIHGAPRKIETMQDYLSWDAMYRKRYFSRKMRRFMWFAFFDILAVVYGVAALTAATGFLWVSDKSTAIPSINGMFVLLFAVIPAALAAAILPLIDYWSSRRETKSA